MNLPYAPNIVTAELRRKLASRDQSLFRRLLKTAPLTRQIDLMADMLDRAWRAAA
jgi:hypothetical protein